MKIISLGLQLLLMTVATTPQPFNHEHGSREAPDYLTRSDYLMDTPPQIGLMIKKKKIKTSSENNQKYDELPGSRFPVAPSQKVTITLRFSTPNSTKAHEKKQKRFNLHGTKWKKTELTWKLVNDNNDGLTRDEVENTLMKAFSMWESVSNLKFRKLSINSSEIIDIEVLFAEGRHNDLQPFDGKGGALGHSFFPETNEGLSGDIHFDDAEKFMVNSTEGTSLLQIAVHNIGQSIGLDNSNVRESVMHPFYKSNKGNNIQLTEDDILGIQALYGKPRLSAL